MDSPPSWAKGFDAPAARFRAATSAISSRVNEPASSPVRACRAAIDTESSHNGPTV